MTPAAAGTAAATDATVVHTVAAVLTVMTPQAATVAAALTVMAPRAATAAAAATAITADRATVVPDAPPPLASPRGGARA